MKHENSTTSQNKFTGLQGTVPYTQDMEDNNAFVAPKPTGDKVEKVEAVANAKLRSESFDTTSTPVVVESLVEEERLIHPDEHSENGVGTSFDTWLKYYGKLYPDVDLIHFYETKEIRNKRETPPPDANAAFKVSAVVASMNSGNTDSIATNAAAETDFGYKNDQQNMVNNPDIALVVAEEQNNFVKPQVGDYSVYLDREIVVGDLFEQQTDSDPDDLILTQQITGLSFIPLNLRPLTHPNGISEVDEGGNVVNYSYMKEALNDGTPAEIMKITQVGLQVLAIAEDNFHYVQNELNILYKKALKGNDREAQKHALKLLKKNKEIQDIKAKKIKVLYNLDSLMIKANAPGAQRAYLKQQQTKNFEEIRDGMAASQDLIDDLSNQLDRKDPFGTSILAEGSEEYNKVYAQLEFAQGEHRRFTKKYDFIVNNIWNAKLVYGGIWDKNQHVFTRDIPEAISNVFAGAGKGLVEGVVNNTWSLASDSFYLVSGLQREGDVWRLETTSNREGVLYDLTAVMVEYMTPFMAARGALSKLSEATKDIYALFVTGAWMKPEEGNIIHAINNFSNDELDWLSSMGVSPDVDDPMYKKILMSMVEGTEAFTIELAKLDITPDKGSPQWDRALQRASASLQEGVLGALFHGLVWLNRMGGKEIWHAIKAQKKYATLSDRAIESVTGINVFGNRVNRLHTSAKFYHSLGKNPDYIYKRTGYHQDPKGNWRFRGDYSKGTWTNMVEGSRKLPQVLDDKTLYGLVPEARNTNIVFAGERSPGTVGAEYRPGTNTIVIYAKNYDSMKVKSKIWHEIQHNIDNIKGYDAGAEPRDFHPTLNLLESEYSKKIYDARQGVTPAEKKVIAKIKAGIKLTKKDLKALDDIDSKVFAIQHERDAIVGTTGRPKDIREWGGPRDTSQYSRTALKIKLDVAGEQRAVHIEKTWFLSYKDIKVIEYRPTTVYLSDFNIIQTPTSIMQAEVSYVLSKIMQNFEDVGGSLSNLSISETDVFALLQLNNPAAHIKIQKAVGIPLLDHYKDVVITKEGMKHVLGRHIPPDTSKTGKPTDFFKDPRDILSVVDLITKIRPVKKTDPLGVDTLVYTVNYEGEPAYKLVLRVEDLLNKKGNPVPHQRTKKNKLLVPKPMKVNALVTFFPVKGFDKVSMRDLLAKITDTRNLNISKQLSTDEAEAIIATVSLEPLKVQQRVLSAKIRETKDPIQRAVIIARVTDINAEIKTNKQSNVKLSILDEIETVDWNNQVYSKLENFVKTLPNDKVFKNREDILIAAAKFGVPREEILASKFFVGRGGLYADLTKGDLLMQIEGRKDQITYRSWLAEDVKVDPSDLHIETGNNGDGTTYVEDVDTGNLVNIEENMDSGLYTAIDGYGNPIGDPMDEFTMLNEWMNENLEYFMKEDLPEAYMERSLIKRGDESWVDGADNDHLGYQVGFDSNGNVVPIEDATTVTNYHSEEDAMMVINHQKYQDILHDDMGNNGYEWHVEYMVDGRYTFRTLDEARENATQMLFDWHQEDLDGTAGRLHQQFTVASEYGELSNYNATNYKLDTYNVDNFEPRYGDRGARENMPNMHWNELNYENASLQIPQSGAFNNMNIIAWVRGHEWVGNRQILDELQSDWAQKWAKNNKVVQELLVEHNLVDAPAEDINKFIFDNRQVFVEHQRVANIMSKHVRDSQREHESYVENLNMSSAVEFEGDTTYIKLDGTKTRNRWNLKAFVKESQDATVKNLDAALEAFVDTMLTPNGKTLDDFTHLDFRPWLQKKMKAYKGPNTVNSSEPWLYRLMEEGSTVSTRFSQRMEKSTWQRIPTDDEAVAINRIYLDDIENSKSFPRDLIHNATKRYMSYRNDKEAQQAYRQSQEVWNRVRKLDTIVPRPPLGETSSYVRITLLDQLTKAINSGKKEFGWWDANVQNKRWHRLTNTNNQSVTIEGIGVTDEGEWLVRHTDQDGNMVQSEWKRSDLVEHLNERQVGEIDTELAKHVGKNYARNPTGDMFGSIEVQAEMTDSPVNLYMFKKPLQTGSVFDSQYNQVMVNVMNKLLNSKKTGIKMERQLDNYVPVHYWKLVITDEVKDLILGQKHQLYK